MDFELTSEQVDLQDLVRGVAQRECPTTLLRAVLDGGDQADQLWKTLVGLDLLSLTIPEEDGGMGFGAVELVVVLEELGYVADPTPLLATTSQFVPLVRTCPDVDMRRLLLSSVCAGSPGAAVLDAPLGSATADDGVVLNGEARFVLDADRAVEVAVAIPSADGTRVAVVDRSAVDVERTATFDPTLHVATVTFNDVRVPAARTWLVTEQAFGLVRTEALAGMSAGMVGASRRVLDLALEHLRERKQFGVPIGSFQALKHMAVDAYISIERARALHQYAALVIAEEDPRWVTAGSMAKAAAGDCQRLVAQHGIQFFGGLGYTWENDLHLFVRRAKVGEALLGSAAHHRDLVATHARTTVTSEVAR